MLGNGALLFRVDKIRLFYWLYSFLVLKEIVIDKINLENLFPESFLNVGSRICILAIVVLGGVELLRFTKFTGRELILCFICIVVFLISAYETHTTTYFLGMLVVICSKDIDFEKLCRYSMRLMGGIITVTAILALFGFIEMGVGVRSYMDSLRYSMGFNHPNTFALLSFQWIAEYTFVNRKKMDIKKYGGCILAVISVYMITNSNTFFIIAFLMMAVKFSGQYMFGRMRTPSGTIKNLVNIGLVLGFLIVVGAVCYIWSDPYMLSGRLNTFRARFTQSQKYLTAYGVKLFGNNIVTGTSVSIPGFKKGYFYLDNGYFRLLIECGIAIFGCMFLIMFRYFRKLVKSNQWNILMLTLCMCAYAFLESKVLSVSFNIFLIHIGKTLYERHDKGTYS